jgi:predicted aspartyl protease
MGLISRPRIRATVKVKVTNPASLDQFFETEVLVDTGALYSVIPKSMLEKLQIKPIWKKRFTLANGDKIVGDSEESGKRDVGGVIFEWNGYGGYSPVVFGEEKDKALLGAFSLEAMGFEVSLVKGELRPMELLLL